LLFEVGAVHLRVALPVLGGGGLLGGGLLGGGLLGGGLLGGGLLGGGLLGGGLLGGGLLGGGLLGGGFDPEVPVALGGLLVALAAGELEPEPPPQPARISIAAPSPHSVFNDANRASSSGIFGSSRDAASDFSASGSQRLAAKPIPANREPLDSMC
jgi:hypothetical protein